MLKPALALLVLLAVASLTGAASNGRQQDELSKLQQTTETLGNSIKMQHSSGDGDDDFDPVHIPEANEDLADASSGDGDDDSDPVHIPEANEDLADASSGDGDDDSDPVHIPEANGDVEVSDEESATVSDEDSDLPLPGEEDEDLSLTDDDDGDDAVEDIEHRWLCKAPNRRIISRGKRKTCTVAGDPHFYQFDKKAFHVQNQGQFVFSKATGMGSGDYEIQIQTYRCGSRRRKHPTYGWVSCTRRMAASFGTGRRRVTLFIDGRNNKLMVNGESKKIKKRKWYKDHDVKFGLIRRRSGKSYRYVWVIENTASGLRVEFYSTVVIISAPSAYNGRTKGLCGDDSGKFTKIDFSIPSGKPYKIRNGYNSRGIRSRDVSRWERTWAVTKSMSLFPKGMRITPKRGPTKRHKVKWPSSAARKEAHKFCKSLALEAQEYFNCLEDMRHSKNDKSLAREQQVLESELHALSKRQKTKYGRGKVAVLRLLAKIEIELYTESQDEYKAALNKIRSAQKRVQLLIDEAEQRIEDLSAKAKKQRKVVRKTDKAYNEARGEYRSALSVLKRARRSVVRQRRNMRRELNLIKIMMRSIKRLGNGKASESDIQSAAAAVKRLKDQEVQNQVTEFLQQGDAKFKRHHSSVTKLLQLLEALKRKILGEMRGLKKHLVGPKKGVRDTLAAKRAARRRYIRALRPYKATQGKISQARRDLRKLHVAMKKARRDDAKTRKRAIKQARKQARNICAEIKKVEKIRAVIVRWIKGGKL